ncbi:RUN and FYVE domain-containing protein 2 isoform X16 [Hippopotamus amphibius kiboko]|uniref:RUN and FYVE domain-containing protein 2 isoform X16 n=2 Tax=Hippopotamus amphibius kiboko TaxID=575201 RepID=UPI002594D80D|nr:RUN and FYVE domain-containing protein 2 isoform X16 [Hippopotamus amphibius kiboko]
MFALCSGNSRASRLGRYKSVHQDLIWALGLELLPPALALPAQPPQGPQPGGKLRWVPLAQSLLQSCDQVSAGPVVTQGSTDGRSAVMLPYMQQEGKQATSNFESLQKQLARKMKLPIFIADAFTAKAFCGNPAAVCLLENKLDEDMHQKIAKEMNLSETAFIRKLHPTDNFTQSSCFGLRWFTPVSEVPLCGHATLASAAVLFHKIQNVNSILTFVTLSGELKARREEDGIVLDLPFYPAHPQDFHEVEDLIKTAIGDTLVQDIRYSPDTQKLLVRLSDTYNRSFLESLKVNTQNLLQVENTGKVKGLILTLKGEPDGQTQAFDFYSRYFAPWVGVAEDPVTGSAHTVLSSYWSQQLGKKDLHAFQCSSRGGELKISLRPHGRVDIKGGAALVLEGTLTA